MRTDLSLLQIAGVTSLTVVSSVGGAVGNPQLSTQIGTVVASLEIQSQQLLGTLTLGQFSPQVSVDIIAGPPGSTGAGYIRRTSPAYAWQNGLLADVSYSNGDLVSFVYDGTQRLVSLTDVSENNSFRRDFTWNPDGSLASISDIDL